MELHGGNIYDYMEKSLVDFSSNINPFGVPESFKKKLQEELDKGLERLTAYPDIHYRKLRENLSSYAGVEPEYIFPGNGAVDVLYRSIRGSACDQVWIMSPTFSEYRKGAGLAGKAWREMAFQDFERGTLDTERLLEEIEKSSEGRILVVLCNPNNPNGGRTNPEEIGRMAKALEKKGGRLLVDEAFIEFAEDTETFTFLPELDRCKNVTVVRAITKFFGMPGIRLGYGITKDREWLSQIQEEEEPWGINAFAEMAAEVIFSDQEYIKATKMWLEEERPAFLKKLKKFSWLKVYPTWSDFVFLRVNREYWDMSRDVLSERLLEKGFLIRKGAGFHGIEEEQYTFRIAIKEPRSNESLIQALKEIEMEKRDEISHY